MEILRDWNYKESFPKKSLPNRRQMENPLDYAPLIIILAVTL